MSYWTKIIIAINAEDKKIIKEIEQICGPVGRLKIDILSTLFYIDTKRSVLNELLWKLRNLDFAYPESVQIFFQGEDDFKYRIVDIFAEKQNKIDKEEGRNPENSPLFFNTNLVETLKPENWDEPIIKCKPNKAGWIKCPGCNISFKPYDKSRFTDSRHHCGQKIEIET